MQGFTANCQWRLRAHLFGQFFFFPPDLVPLFPPKVKKFRKIFKVQKVITLEDLQSASHSQPAGRQRPRWAGLFPLRTLKYFEILTKSKR